MIGRSDHALYIGRLFGIRLYLDFSWFLLAAGMVYILAVDILPDSIAGYSRAAYMVMAVSAAAVFFLSILLHELGHSLVSQRCGIPVPRITLMLIGGIAEISREPDSARAELKIAAGGPAVTVILTLLYAAAGLAAELLRYPAVSIICQWLAEVNISLFLFNLIPGYPLDGGRILRAMIWSRTGDLRKATYIASRIGIGVGWSLMALGLVLCYMGIWNAFVFFFIGIFLKGAADSGYTHTINHAILGNLRVADIMTRDPICIPDRTPLSMAVEDYFLSGRYTAYPVADEDGNFRGLLRMEYLKALPREKWAFTTAGDFAAAHNDILSTIDINHSAEYAMQCLGGAHTMLAVLDNGKVAGIVTLHDTLHFISIHTELKPDPAPAKAALSPGDKAGRP